MTMGALAMAVLVVLVQLESWSGHVELLQADTRFPANRQLELVLWRLRRYSRSCIAGRRVAVANCSLEPTRHDAPVRFRRLPQGFYCFSVSARGEQAGTVRSPVAVLTGQGPRDRCCEHAPGQRLLWSMAQDGTLSASMSVNSSELACQLFMASLYEGGCQDLGKGPRLVARYQVARNSVFHAHGLKTERHYCLAVAAGCHHCPMACAVLESKTVGAGVERGGADDGLLEFDQGRGLPAADAQGGLDPVLAVLGVGSVIFLLAWALHLYQRLPLGALTGRKRAPRLV